MSNTKSIFGLCFVFFFCEIIILHVIIEFSQTEYVLQLQFNSNYCYLIESRIFVKETFMEIADIEKKMSNLSIEPGGMWKPKTCIARYKVAIVVPYRDRLKELSLFLQHMHPFLQRQNLYYRIYIVEQVSHLLINYTKACINKNTYIYKTYRGHLGFFIIGYTSSNR